MSVKTPVNPPLVLMARNRNLSRVAAPQGVVAEKGAAMVEVVVVMMVLLEVAGMTLMRRKSIPSRSIDMPSVTAQLANWRRL